MRTRLKIFVKFEKRNGIIGLICPSTLFCILYVLLFEIFFQRYTYTKVFILKSHRKNCFVNYGTIKKVVNTGPKWKGYTTLRTWFLAYWKQFTKFNIKNVLMWTKICFFSCIPQYLILYNANSLYSVASKLEPFY